ncbi:DUF5808 domain-containing protein [Flavobacterium sp. A45]|jgi:uncharacterized membrane protein|uniref:DUF5808 domain-containing protein n=1 Tax=Flavobacterium sp. A45 TaxID=1945862 RepID=UPI0009853894|nr:DUF5808 domain-containing protein [Flavobacterium sp. A45]OOG71478.1 hypothetical protein B0E44_10135 [Flavobacterium sp. A45]
MALNQDPSKETLDKWNKDPNNWIWGIFYYNKEDKRIFPPKRIEDMGSTINFANPKSILALLIALAFFGMVIFFILNK